MSDRFERMLQLQAEFQRLVPPGVDLTKLADNPELRMDKVREMVLACVAELFEALDETGWKPWATSNHLNRHGYLKELVDAWHFFMNLMLIGDIEAEEFYQAYMTKLQVNIARQTEKYDGVETKCRGCKRALDEEENIVRRPDDAEFNFKSARLTGPITYECAGCGTLILGDQLKMVLMILRNREINASVPSTDTDSAT